MVSVIYIYRLINGTWTYDTSLSPSQQSINDRFGESFAFKNDTLFACAPGDDQNAGAVYVFSRDTVSKVWNTNEVLKISNDIAGDGFGHAVSFDGTSLAISSVPADMYAGSVYIYPDVNDLNSYQILTSPVTGVEEFGNRLNLMDDTIIIQSCSDIFVYQKLGENWSILNQFWAGSPYCGTASINENTFLIGLPGQPHEGEGPYQNGAVHLYSKVEGVWTHITTWTPFYSSPDYGNVVDAGDKVAIVGGAGNSVALQDTYVIPIYYVPEEEPQPLSCEEVISGSLDVIGQPFCSDGVLEVPVRIVEAPNDVEAFGFEVTFDPELLQFDSVVSGVDGLQPGMIGGFQFWNANLVAPGVVRIGGASLENTISAGASGILCYVRFNAITAQETQISLQNLVDDMASWDVSAGCLTRADGDLNLDGAVTPADALCSLQKATNVCETYCGPCEGLACDVDMDCNCTANDTICILYNYLDLPSCLDDLGSGGAQEDLELAGSWALDHPFCTNAVITATNTFLVAICDGTVTMAGDIVYYDNSQNFAILHLTAHMDTGRIGLFQKISWSADPGSTVEIQQHFPMPSAFSAIYTPHTEDGDPMVLTRME